jgi:hypothetical protein
VISGVLGVFVMLGIIGAATGSGSKNKSETARPRATTTLARTSTTEPAPTTTSIDADGGGQAPTVHGQPVAANSGVATGNSACRSGNPLANVYHPDRLQVLSACRTVTGIVRSVRREQDGDVHIDVELDQADADAINAKNVLDQHGWLVVEIVPADEPGCAPGQPPRPATGTYDYGICTGANELAPTVGKHVAVTGPWVTDNFHGWNEIHPAWAIGMPFAPPPAAGAWPTTRPPQAEPPATNPSPSVGVHVTSVSNPAPRNSTAHLTATTGAGVACNITVTYASGHQSTAAGLGPATADGSGNVSWNWKVGGNTGPGTATATVTCGGASDSAKFEVT